MVALEASAHKLRVPEADLGTVLPELIGSLNLIFYSSAEDAVFKTLGVE